MCGYPHILTVKAFTFCKLKLNLSTTFKVESYLLPFHDQLPLAHLAAQSEVVNSLVQRLWNAFSKRCFLASVSP